MTETLRTWWLLRDLRRGARRSPAAVARLQARLLRAVVRHAYDHVPLYRRRWDRAGLDPSSVRGPEDLDRIPPLPGDVARRALESGELLARGVDPAGMLAFPTSGSSGRPMWVPRGSAEQRRWRAVGLRTWFEHGYRWPQVTVQLDAHPGVPHPLQRLGVSRTRWVSTELPVEEQAQLLAAARPDIVVGTPTVLRRLVRAMDAAGLAVDRPPAVFCHGELLDAATRAMVARVLGAAPIGLYGLTELGYAAWQCERRDGYHVNAETCLVEVVREGRPARAGELGAVLVTDLHGRTAPLVRYETGDLAVAAAGSCPCGRTLPLLGSIEGRARDAVTLADGRVLTARAVVDHMSDVLPPDRYRLHQEEPTRFRLHLGAGSQDGVVGHLLALLGEVEVVTVAGVPPGGGRDKSRPVASAVTASPLGAPG